jgi:hypothetical protein
MQKIYKVKAPNGQVSKQIYSRALAFRIAKNLSKKTGQEYKPFVFEERVIVHDHELSQVDSRYYTITHYQVVS